MELQTLVVGVDGSDSAAKALDAAISLAADGAVVHVVTAYDEPSAARIHDLYAHIPDEFLGTVDILAQDRGYLADAVAVLADHDIAAESHFVDGDPASAILDVAEAADADLIVVGSRGLGRATRFLRGSVSAKVASHARTSFLIMHD